MAIALSIASVPFKSKHIQSLDSVHGNVAGKSSVEKFVLPSLALYPGGKWDIGRIGGRNVAVSGFTEIVCELREAFGPGGRVGVPYESNGIELNNAGISHCRLLSLLLELVLIALPSDPA